MTGIEASEATVKEGKELSAAERLLLEDLVRQGLLREAAYHEAGHAVIGRAMGQLCGYVTIVPNESSGGHHISAGIYGTFDAWKYAGRIRAPRTILIGSIIEAMAGAEAVRELLRIDPAGDDGDRDAIVVMMGDLLIAGAPIEIQTYIENRFRTWTRYLARHHGEKIKRVAEALLELKTLRSKEVDAIIGRPSLQPTPDQAMDQLRYG